jgi:hypothetical protein
VGDIVRIAFDLDDTLIGDFPLESAPWGLLPWLIPHERLREGTRTLFGELKARGHEIWVYSTSLRAPLAVHCTFWAHGLHVSGVISESENAAMQATFATRFAEMSKHPPSKYPPAWAIDLIVDDSEGVAEEGDRYGFKVNLVLPSDPNWTQHVLNSVALINRERSAAPTNRAA